MLQIVKQPENGGAGYVLVAVMDGDPGKWMTLFFWINHLIVNR